MEKIVGWLLSGDPSIRWQVMTDLLNEEDGAVHFERLRTETEGWGYRLLSFQGEDGKWSGQLYNGKWVSTTYSMLLLKEFGVLPNKKTDKACQQLVTGGLFNGEEIRFSSKQKLRDNGVTGLALSILSYFEYEDDCVHQIADYLIRAQNSDGSWFFDDRNGAEKYSFENTMIILKGLLEYQKKFPNHNQNLIEAQRKGQEYLLKNDLFKDPKTSLPINQKWLKISFPYYWFYDVLVALDYFREANVKDKRLQNALKIIQNKQNNTGTWNLENKHAGKTVFEMEQVGKPSRGNTLRCLRAIKWWEKSEDNIN
jgi:hypothetical protein